MYFRGYSIRPANPTGGKAGKGRNKTSTIQVIDPQERRMLKHFRYTTTVPGARDSATRKAVRWVYDQTEAGRLPWLLTPEGDEIPDPFQRRRRSIQEALQKLWIDKLGEDENP